MNNDISTETITEPTVPATTPAVASAAPVAAHAGPRRERAPRARRAPRRGGRDDRTRSEYDQKTLQVRRVARVVAGGRRFNFSVLVAIGNRKGSVGVGTGKAADTSAAVDKATNAAKQALIKVARTETQSIAHQVEAKYSSAIVVIRPAPNKGLIAGSATRTVLELAGITNVSAKILSGSKNKLNIARATIEALKELTYEDTNSTNIRMTANSETQRKDGPIRSNS